jgi:hypothetical protein
MKSRDDEEHRNSDRCGLREREPQALHGGRVVDQIFPENTIV